MPEKFPKITRNRRYKLKKKYKLSESDYNDLLEKQGFGCKICGKPWTFEVLVVDHDHKSGKVRGILCTKCNSVLGFADDNQTILLKAIQYLKGNLK